MCKYFAFSFHFMRCRTKSRPHLEIFLTFVSINFFVKNRHEAIISFVKAQGQAHSHGGHSGAMTPQFFSAPKFCSTQKMFVKT